MTDDSIAIALREPAALDSADDADLQRLWLSLRHRWWRSLAVVSAAETISAIDVAKMLAWMAWSYTGQSACVFDMCDASLRLLEDQARELASHAHGEWIFVALRSSPENPTTVPIARAADAAVLCVRLNETDMNAARKTLDAVGRERFLGTIVVSPS